MRGLGENEVEQNARWDVSSPGFLVTILRVMALLGAIAVALGALAARAAFTGLLSGVVLALLFYLAALLAGWIFLRTRNLVPVMLWLLGSQAVLWVGMALLLTVVKVDAAGFAVGVSVLPGAVILGTLYWWLVKHRGVIP